MMINKEKFSPVRTTIDRKRLGRGIGSGHGKTSSRGHKGQRSRSGHKISVSFEGGQMPFYRRIPKNRGFKRTWKVPFQVVNLNQLIQKDLTTVTPTILYQLGLIRSMTKPVKILGTEKITKPIMIHAHAISKSAADAIELGQGKFEKLEMPARRQPPKEKFADKFSRS